MTSTNQIAKKKLTRAYEIPAVAVAKLLEDPVAVRLGHARVDVVAAVAKVRYLLGQQFYALRRVAEDDRLIDAQLQHTVNFKQRLMHNPTANTA